jgi:hypothetical protein
VTTRTEVKQNIWKVFGAEYGRNKAFGRHMQSVQKTNLKKMVQFLIEDMTILSRLCKQRPDVA